MSNIEPACSFEEIEIIVQEIADECGRTTKESDSFKNVYEGIAVIEEKLDELWSEIKSGRNKRRMKKKATRLAAMVVQFIHDICDHEMKI